MKREQMNERERERENNDKKQKMLTTCQVSD